MIFSFENESYDFSLPDIVQHPMWDEHMTCMYNEVYNAIHNQYKVDLYIESPDVKFSHYIDGTAIKSFTYSENTVQIVTEESTLILVNPELEDDDVQNTYYKLWLKNDHVTIRVTIYRG